MPIYEYQCGSCGKIFEEWQSGFEEREMECPECGGESKRLISHSSFHLKGSGWYADGYGGTSAGNKPGDAQQPTGGGEESSAKADTAPASNCSAKSADSSSADSAS